MNRMYYIKNLLFAVVLLASFLAVFVTTFVCNLKHFTLFEKESATHSHHHEKATGANHHLEYHHHDKQASYGQHHTNTSLNKRQLKHHYPKYSSCCKDLTSGFFNALFYKFDFKLVFNKDFPVYVSFSYLYKYELWYNSYLKKSLPNKSPPPKVPDIRIFIQSFII